MSDDTHSCPGCSTARVQRSQLACKPCWFRLPAPLRNAVNGAYRRRLVEPAAHRAALTAALRWFREHPIGGDS